jgi:hypothetical protein
VNSFNQKQRRLKLCQKKLKNVVELEAFEWATERYGKEYFCLKDYGTIKTKIDGRLKARVSGTLQTPYAMNTNHLKQDPQGDFLGELDSSLVDSSIIPPLAKTGNVDVMEQLNPCQLRDPIDSDKCSRNNVAIDLLEWFESDAANHPYERAWSQITVLLNYLAMSKNVPENLDFTQCTDAETETGRWWKMIQDYMISMDSDQRDDLSVQKMRLAAIQDSFKDIYVVQAAEDYTKNGEWAPIPVTETFEVDAKPDAISPLDEEWMMIYEEEMCDETLFLKEDSNSTLYPVPLAGDLLSAMESTANDARLIDDEHTLSRAMIQWNLQDGESPVRITNGPLRIQNPDEASKKDGRPQNNLDTDAETDGRLLNAETKQFLFENVWKSASSIDTSSPTKREYFKKSNLASNMKDYLDSLKSHRWTNFTPQLKGFGGEEIASSKVWMRHLRTVYETLYAQEMNSPDILSKWARYSPAPAQLFYKNMQHASGQPVPPVELREEVGSLDYVSWTLTTPKFLGANGVPLGPEAEWDELSRLLTLKLDLLCRAEESKLHILTPAEEQKFRIIQLRMEKLEAMRDRRFIAWMDYFGSEHSGAKTSNPLITPDSCIEDGNYICPLKGRELIRRYAPHVPDHEIEFGTMFEAISIDAKNPHPKDPGNGILDYTFGTAWELEESKAEAIQRMPNLGGFTGVQRLILVALVSHAKYIKRRAGEIAQVAPPLDLQITGQHQALWHTKPPNWFIWLTQCERNPLSLQAWENIQCLALMMMTFADRRTKTVSSLYVREKSEWQEHIIYDTKVEPRIRGFWDCSRSLYAKDRALFRMVFEKLKEEIDSGSLLHAFPMPILNVRIPIWTLGDEESALSRSNSTAKSKGVSTLSMEPEGSSEQRTGFFDAIPISVDTILPEGTAFMKTKAVSLPPIFTFNEDDGKQYVGEMVQLFYPQIESVRGLNMDSDSGCSSA